MASAGLKKRRGLELCYAVRRFEANSKAVHRARGAQPMAEKDEGLGGGFLVQMVKTPSTNSCGKSGSS